MAPFKTEAQFRQTEGRVKDVKVKDSTFDPKGWIHLDTEKPRSLAPYAPLFGLKFSPPGGN